MLQFVCDWCNRLKKPVEEGWIVGVAAENVAPTAARREIIVHSRWNRNEAVGLFAVHFCCERCKDKYISALFENPSDVLKTRNVKRGVSRTDVQPRTVRRRKAA